MERGARTASKWMLPAGTIQVITCTASRPARTAGFGAAQLAGGRRVDRHHRDAAQAHVVLVEEWSTAEQVPLVAQVGPEGEVGVLQPHRTNDPHPIERGRASPSTPDGLL